MKYYLYKVLHFNHDDFLTAFKVDLAPLLGETGLWALKNYEIRQSDKGNEEKKKRARVGYDLIQEFLEHGFDNLSKLVKFNLKNKYNPKKLPDQAITRESIPHLYSWVHYAPLSWFQHIRKLEEDVIRAQKNEGAPALFNMCSYCGSPESLTMKHKRCSQCKQRIYCTSDCQKFDWKKGHGKECKNLADKLSKKERLL